VHLYCHYDNIFLQRLDVIGIFAILVYFFRRKKTVAPWYTLENWHVGLKLQRKNNLRVPLIHRVCIRFVLDFIPIQNSLHKLFD
jgi:hypothetical protein